MTAMPATSVPNASLGLERLIGNLDTVSLTEGNATSARRFDRKFIVPVSAFAQMMQQLTVPRDDGQCWRVLEIAGQRIVQYHTVYFDTTDLRLYRDHLQGRRRRYKIRTRRYSTGTHMLEIKLKGIRGQTEKVRRERAGDISPSSLEPVEEHWLDSALQAYFSRPAPKRLHASAHIFYNRICLVGPDDARLTIDLDLAVSGADGTDKPDGGPAPVNPNVAIIESKSPTPTSDTERLLRRIVRRPHPLSKYAVALAVTRDVRSNPWLPALRRLNVAPSASGPHAPLNHV